MGDLIITSEYIQNQLKVCGGLRAIPIFVLARDQALFKALLFAGDRAGDLLEIKTSEILSFPNNSGFLFNLVWTKSLRSGNANVFAFRWCSNPNVCPDLGLELYVNACNLLRIRFAPGFLFRPVTKSNGVGSSCLEHSGGSG